MTTDWKPMCVLPNIPLEREIGCEIAALAPANDYRVASLKRAYPNFRGFLNRFADNLALSLSPACPTAFNRDPISARKRDPFSGGERRA